jgi:hypothetical protein
VQALVRVLATVLIAVGVAVGQGQVANPPGTVPEPEAPPLLDDSAAALRAPFVWKSTYSEALRAGRGRSRPVVIYFPPVRDSAEPSVVARLPKLFGVPPTVEGVRVGADEILPLMKRFQITKVPALVLIDLRENVLSRWQRGLEAPYISNLRSAIRRFHKREAQDVARVGDARRLVERGEPDAAYPRIATLLGSKHTSPRVLAAARQVEQPVLKEFERALYRVLAREGLRSDKELRAALKKLRSRCSHPEIQKMVDRELKRLLDSESRIIP